jgi:hypothetical protein
VISGGRLFQIVGAEFSLGGFLPGGVQPSVYTTEGSNRGYGSAARPKAEPAGKNLGVSRIASDRECVAGSWGSPGAWGGPIDPTKTFETPKEVAGTASRPKAEMPRKKI